MELNLFKLTKMHVWIQLPNLLLKYWGKGSLEKIISLVGDHIKPDSATQMKDRISYARYLVEVDINDDFP